MTWLSGPALLCAVFLFTACSTTRPADRFLARYGNTDPRPDNFVICYANSCGRTLPVSLTALQWQRVRAIFSPPAADAAGEREHIRVAVALMEQLVGRQTGTDQDMAEAQAGQSLPGQLDCIDEAFNTATYLTLMDRDRLIRYHRFYAPVVRGFFFKGWPHYAVVLVDMHSGARYVLDAWFMDNGELPFILPLTVWRGGWRPEQGLSLD